MATRDEIKLNSRKKEVQKLTEWIEKKEIVFDKYLKEVNDKGYLLGFKDTFIELNKDLPSRYKDIKTSLYHVPTRFCYDEADRAYDKKDNKTFKRIHSITSMYTEIIEKKVNLNLYTELLAKQQEIVDKQAPLSKEAVKAKEEKSEYQNLRKYIETELDNIKIPSLENWLVTFRKLYIEWVEQNTMLKEFQRREQLRRADDVVRKQKLEIVARSWNAVGRIQKIEQVHLGSDGSFNGIVVGEKGVCRVETIIAGGYNIQVLHYRVLVKEYTDKYAKKQERKENPLNPKIKELFEYNILEVKQSYASKVPYLTNYPDDSKYLIKSSEIVSRVSSNSNYLPKFPMSVPSTETRIVIYTGYASLTKKEKEIVNKFLVKLHEVYPTLGIFVLNSSKQPIVLPYKHKENIVVTTDTIE